MDETSKRPQTGAKRQAAYAERRRRMSPLERDLHLPATEIYSPNELALLERIHGSRERLIADCRSLNKRLAMRLLAEAFAPHADPDRLALNERIQALLKRRTLLSLPAH